MNVHRKHKRIERHKVRRALYKAADKLMRGSDWRLPLEGGNVHPHWAAAFAEVREYKASTIIAIAAKGSHKAKAFRSASRPIGRI
jgi:hypothetical protein